MRREAVSAFLLSLLAASLFVAVFNQPKTVRATTLFSNGFEEGKFNPAAGVWTGNFTDNGGVASVQSTIKYGGTYAANLTTPSSGRAYAYKKLASNYTTVFLSTYLRASTLPTSQVTRHGLLWIGPSSSIPSPTTWYGVQVIWNFTSGVGVFWALVLRDAGASWRVNVTAVTPSVDTWYHVVLAGYSHVSSGNVTLYVDDVKIATLSGYNTVWGTHNFDEVAVYCFSYGVTQKAYYDDVVVTDVYQTESAPSIVQINQNTTLAGEVVSLNARWQANTGNLSHHILSFDNGTSTYTNDTAVAFSAGVSVAWANVTSHRINVTSGTTCHWKSYANNTAGLWSVSSTQTFETTTSAASLTIQSTPISVVYGINSSAYTFPSWTVPTPVTASGIQTAVDAALAAGGGTVYIPAGDWTVNQAAIQAYGEGGAVSINLETLPENAWLNIIGQFTNTTVITQDGQTLKDVPNVILRSHFTINSSLGSGRWGTFGVVGSATGGANYNNYKSQNRHIRISGLTILGDVSEDPGGAGVFSNNGISIQFVDGYLIDHCAIDSQTGSGVNSIYSKGVVSHCIITDLYHEVIGGASGYGVGVGGNWGYYNNGLGDPTWIENVSQVIGKYDWQGITLNWTTPVEGDLSVQGTTSSISFTAGPVYIEYSQFNATRHPVASSAYAYYVFRFNECYGGVGIQAIDQHGGGWSVAANAYAGRGCEVYNNTVDGDVPELTGVSSYSAMIRGGAGLIFNNTFIDTYTGIKLGNENYNASEPTYPEYINDLWMWNNTFSGVTGELSVAAGQGIVAGTNYFSDIPTPTTPAPPKPSYTTYTTPHPLTLGSYFGTTNITLTLQPASYVVQVPDSVIVNQVSYTFTEWEDSSTNPTRTITLTSNTVITANYTTGTATHHWQMTFSHKDLDLTNIDSYVTWTLYNGSTPLTYSEGTYTLIDGTYTLKTSYLGQQISQTSLSTTIYGNTTITINTQMKTGAGTSRKVAANQTLSMLILVDTTATFRFNATGSITGTVLFVISATQNASSIKKDGIILSYGAGTDKWLYDSVNGCYKISVTSLSQFEVTLPSETQGGISMQLSLMVVVVDSSEAVVYQAKVTVYSMRMSVVASALTSQRGEAGFSLSKGEYLVEASKGLLSGSRFVNLVGNTEVTVSLGEAADWWTRLTKPLEVLVEPVREVGGVAWGWVWNNFLIVGFGVVGCVVAVYGSREDDETVVAVGGVVLAVAFVFVVIRVAL